jgi:mono/diheme cytochrome c family protein
MRALLASIALLAFAAPAAAETLTLADRRGHKEFTTDELLANPAAVTFTIEKDPVFRQTMTYRAIPVGVLLKGLTIDGDDYVQARAIDDFSIGVPARLLVEGSAGGVEAFLAIEDPRKLWPQVPGKTASAGPFMLVWRAKNPRDVSSEYWAYSLAGLSVTDSPMKRWPVLAVAAGVPANDPVRRGLDKFVQVCIACHHFKGAGEGDQGPDLGQPMNPVDYFQVPALKKLLRDPTSVRTWTDRKMPEFAPDTLSDGDIDDIVAWLAYKARP